MKGRAPIAMAGSALDFKCPVCDENVGTSSPTCRRCRRCFHANSCGEIPSYWESSDGLGVFVDEIKEYSSAYCYSCFPAARDRDKRKHLREAQEIRQRLNVRMDAMSELASLPQQIAEAQKALDKATLEYEAYDPPYQKAALRLKQIQDAQRLTNERIQVAVKSIRSAREERKRLRVLLPRSQRLQMQEELIESLQAEIREANAEKDRLLLKQAEAEEMVRRARPEKSVEPKDGTPKVRYHIA